MSSSFLGLKRYFRPSGEKVGSSSLISCLLMALTYLLFSIAPLAAAPPLTFPLLPSPSLFLAHGMYFRTWVLIIYLFYKPSLSLRSFPPTNTSLSSFFRKLAGMTLPFTLTLTVLLLRNTRLFLLLLLSLLL